MLILIEHLTPRVYRVRKLLSPTTCTMLARHTIILYCHPIKCTMQESIVVARQTHRRCYSTVYTADKGCQLHITWHVERRFHVSAVSVNPPKVSRTWSTAPGLTLDRAGISTSTALVPQLQHRHRHRHQDQGQGQDQGAVLRKECSGCISRPSWLSVLRTACATRKACFCN